MNARTALILILTTPVPALAQSVHDADFILAIENDQLITGAVDPETSEILFPQRVKSARLGAEGFPNFSNDPGFDSVLGTLTPGLEVGFSILGALRVWDEVDQDFETLASDSLTVRGAGQDFLVPATDTRVEGVVFGQANNDPGASFHHHLQYLLNGASGPAVDGVFLLQIELWTTSQSVAPTEPLYIVFSQGTGLAQEDAAIAWVENNLVGTPCVADLSGNGVADFPDVGLFLNAFAGGDPAADLSGNGVTDFPDVGIFLAAFTSGCP